MPQLPEDLSAYQSLLDKLLAKDAAQRVASAREVIETLEQAPGFSVDAPTNASEEADAAEPAPEDEPAVAN
jgi:hypothetical protein